MFNAAIIPNFSLSRRAICVTKSNSAHQGLISQGDVRVVPSQGEMCYTYSIDSLKGIPLRGVFHLKVTLVRTGGLGSKFVLRVNFFGNLYDPLEETSVCGAIEYLLFTALAKPRIPWKQRLSCNSTNADRKDHL